MPGFTMEENLLTILNQGTRSYMTEIAPPMSEAIERSGDNSRSKIFRGKGIYMCAIYSSRQISL